MTKITNRAAYLSALAITLFSTLFLMVVIGAVGLIGVEGDPFDLLYFVVVTVGVLGAFTTRLRAEGMKYTLSAMAATQAIIVIVALIVGKQHVEVSSVTEILLLNGFFIALQLSAAKLFAISVEQPTLAE